MKPLVLLIFILPSLSYAARTPNECWNTKISDEHKVICSECTEATNLMMEDLSGPCGNEKSQLYWCLDNFEKCIATNSYETILEAHDNCKTGLINSCYEYRRPE